MIALASALGAELIVLSQVQADHTGVKAQGPLKSGHHQY